MKLKEDVGVLFPQGFLANALECGVKSEKQNKPDLTILISEKPANAAAMFTTNRCCAAPVLVSKAQLETNSKIKAVVTNSGNANAATGEQGLQAAKKILEYTAEKLNYDTKEILICSTGVIGKQLPISNMLKGIDNLSGDFGRDTLKNELFNHAIMTTDLAVKQCGIELLIDGKSVKIGGACKGSGMIMPNMATMLAYITTDAEISVEDLQRVLKKAVGQSFNKISVDGDTSTNDTIIAMANGVSGVKISLEKHAEFCEAINLVCQNLAKKIVLDGEGATKFITVNVCGTKTDAEAETIARTIANSPLFKTAMYGENPNWGRVAAAAGRAGIPYDQNLVEIKFGELLVVKNGVIADYNRDDFIAYLKNKNIELYLKVGNDTGNATIWTCDFSHAYVDINVAYN